MYDLATPPFTLPLNVILYANSVVRREFSALVGFGDGESQVSHNCNSQPKA